MLREDAFTKANDQQPVETEDQPSFIERAFETLMTSVFGSPEERAEFQQWKLQRNLNDHVLRNVLNGFSNVDVTDPKAIEGQIQTYLNRRGEKTINAADVALYARTLDEDTLKGMQRQIDPEMLASIEEANASQAAADAKYEHEMSQWDALSEAVGGDLFDDPDKLEAMRSIDREMGPDVTWNQFHDAVVEAINGPSSDNNQKYIM